MVAEKAKLQFENVNYHLGAKRCEDYLSFIKKKVNGEEDTSFKKFVKFKTLKRTHIETVKADNSLLQESVINDEDIKIFVETIEEDEIKLFSEKRSSSVSIYRKSPCQSKASLFGSKKSVPNLSMSIRNSKSNLRNLKMIRAGKKKLKVPTKFSKLLRKTHAYKKSVISLEKSPSLLYQDSTDTNDKI